MPLKYLKFISKPMICRLSNIVVGSLSEELLECINLQASNDHIILVQVVDIKSNEQEEPRFYAVGIEDEQLKLAGPVDFLNALSKAEAAQLIEL